MEIDFGKAHQVHRNAQRVKRESSFTKLSRKMAIVASALIITFTVGLVSGLGLNKFQGDSNPNNELISPNVSPTVSDDVQIQRAETSSQLPQELNQAKKQTPTQQAEKTSAVSQAAAKNNVSDSLQNDKYSHLILAKVYEDANMAHSAGLKLQKKGLPVFLAASGKRMKLYVGPVQGEKNARNLLAQIKKLPDFRGAILYRK